MDFNAYLANIPVSRRQRFDQIRHLIEMAYPDATLEMQYHMPTFHNDVKGWCALANQKHYISLYTCGEKNIAAFKLNHPTIKMGKGCIKFKDSDELPLTELLQVIHNAMHASVECDR
ncbi:MAG: DUF1801 domain-containing protein [Phycisphaeraceae bacterium]|nr:DUF1801 domain-containing protein [Phycisphaeraceae bacterium]